MAHSTWEDYDRARAQLNTAEYKRNRATVLSPARLVCALCGRAIDKRLRAPHPWSAVADHIIEISDGGNPTALANLQAAHRRCNERKELERRARLDGRTARPDDAVLPLRVVPTDVDTWIMDEEP